MPDPSILSKQGLTCNSMSVDDIIFSGVWYCQISGPHKWHLSCKME